MQITSEFQYARILNVVRFYVQNVLLCITFENFKNIFGNADTGRQVTLETSYSVVLLMSLQIC